MGQPGGAERGIRTQLNRMVLIPSVTFLVLFVVLSATTLAQAVSLRSSVTDGRAGVELAEAVTQLQDERRLSVEYLGDPGGATRQAFVDVADRTDGALAQVHDSWDTLEGSTQTQERLAEEFHESLAAVESMRADTLADPGTGGADEFGAVLETYTVAIHQGIRLYTETVKGLDDGPASDEARAATDLMWAQESFGNADAVITSVLSEDELTLAQQSEVATLRGDARSRLDTGVPVDDGAAEGDLSTAERLIRSEPWVEAMEIVDTVVRHEAAVDVDPFTNEQTRDAAPPSGLDGWRAAADEVNAALVEAGSARVDAVVESTEAASSWMFSLAVGGGITSMFAGTVAYGIAARSAARLTYRLARLKAQTLGIARSDLPRIVRRLEAGESVDLDTEMKQLDHGTDEIGQVADAFDTAQRTAVSAAVKQADIRSGVSRVFLAIAHRNQSLVQRQLQLLDRVEREEEDPDLLESLFQLDHLATRGRRHAENLIILGGAQPGRRWRHPVPLVDILRGAISETDEYARVELVTVPDLSLSGAVVADVIHMLAELVENATAYSPPHTDVTIATENVPKGVAIEIEDRGLGMTEEDLVNSNGTLSDAPEFDVMTPGTDGRLGLFVVARLAQKHDIRVQLRPSPYGGTRAVVLIPGTLVASSAGTGADWPRTAALARMEEGGQGTVRTAADRGDQADLLSAEAGHRQTRPVLRSVPEHTEGGVGTEELARENPVLRQVPDLYPESPEPVRGSGPQPLPKRVVGAGRVGVGPGRAGLPRRNRQAHLAPQLRDDPVSVPAAEEPDPTPQRSPEQARRMMDAFSAGTRRGRAEELEHHGPGHSSDDQVGAGADDHTGESD
ncbi:sensor histidine kinase [Nocardiopsis oceani]